MKKDEKEQLTTELINIFLIVIMLTLLIIILTYLTIKYDWFGLNHVQEQLKEYKQKCLDLGGYIENQGYSIICYSYDAEGYKFYWHEDENGIVYKTRE